MILPFVESAAEVLNARVTGTLALAETRSPAAMVNVTEVADDTGESMTPAQPAGRSLPQVRGSEDQPRDETGKWTSGGGSSGGGDSGNGAGDAGGEAGSGGSGVSGQPSISKPIVATNSKDASAAIASDVSSYIEARRAAGHDMSDAPSEEKIKENWEKVFRSRKDNVGDKAAFTDLDAGRKQAVTQAAESLSGNERFSEFSQEHGQPVVVFRRAEKGNTAMAEFRGAIHVYDKEDAGYGKQFPVYRDFEPGAYSAGDYGGYESLIRHEYGHKLYGTLTHDQQKQWRSEYAKLDKAMVAKELTQYATTNHEECFCEVFAAATDKTAKLPPWAADLHLVQRNWLLGKNK